MKCPHCPADMTLYIDYPGHVFFTCSVCGYTPKDGQSGFKVSPETGGLDLSMATSSVQTPPALWTNFPPPDPPRKVPLFELARFYGTPTLAVAVAAIFHHLMMNLPSGPP